MSESNIKILYNNQDLFKDIAPIPFISSEQNFIDYKNTWNQVTNLKMQGQITGRYLGETSFFELNRSLNILKERLSSNFKELEIKQDNDILFKAERAIFDSLSIPEDKWYGVIPFEINFTVYEPSLFNNYYGIIEPQENLEFKEEDFGIASVTHSLSAKGLKINNKSPLENAKEWVVSRKDNFNKINPILIDPNGSDYLLDSVKEEINRIEGFYSWEGVYQKTRSIESPKNCFLNYSIDISSGVNDGYVVTNIEGSLTKNTLPVLREELDKINFYNIANSNTVSSVGVILNSKPIENSVTEFEYENKISFNYTFNNDYSSDVVNNYSVDISSDNIKNITTVTLNTEIFAKYGDTKTKWEKVKNFYKNSFDPFSLANAEYRKEISNRVLYNKKLNESATFDEFNARINFSATWDDKYQHFSDKILSLQSTVNLKPSVKIYVPNASAVTPGDHNVQDLGTARRARADFDVTAIAKPNSSMQEALSAAQSELGRIKSNYGVGRGVLENNNETINPDLKSVNLKESWLFEGPISS
jgi:hypothetical protein